MFSEYLQAIEGIGAYPLLSLLVFMMLFVGVLVHVVRIKKEEADHMSQLPLN